MRDAIDRAGELVKDGLANARQAVGALRGERLPGVAELEVADRQLQRRHEPRGDAARRGQRPRRCRPTRASPSTAARRRR